MVLAVADSANDRRRDGSASTLTLLLSPPAACGDKEDRLSSQIDLNMDDCFDDLLVLFDVRGLAA
jgi:hypothetical protein